ncbi:hypothetical protein nbrc107696_19640 [Gordonia spumicola]|uniref:Uncharacterized protein n=1 Tax=Gordonia spumicola TaxID=589161 RepID=A0A7I9V806_9ACTN|nr:hypothetical protein nbrc107696_19640 [Gordonia spumicola]
MQKLVKFSVDVAAWAGAAPSVPAISAAPPTRAATRLVVTLMKILRSVHRKMDSYIYDSDHKLSQAGDSDMARKHDLRPETRQKNVVDTLFPRRTYGRVEPC